MRMKKTGSGDSLKSQSEFHRNLQSGRIAPLYLFEGSERYLRDQALNKLLEVAVDAAARDFNFARISVAQGNFDDALALARQFPMISARRVVVVTGFEAISDDKQLDALKDYLRAPSETTALVFVSDALDNRRNMTMLRKACEVVSFDPLDERDAAPQWIRDYVGRSDRFIEPQAAAYLVGMVGVSLTRLSAELDKLINYAGEKGRIGKPEIDELVLNSRQHSNFELTDAILDGDRRRALKLLDRIYANASERPETLSLMILGAIASNYRKMLAAKELMSRNAPNAEVAKAVGMPPFIVTRFNERVRKISVKRILRGIARIAETDVALKTSLATPRLQIEVLICELCPLEDRGSRIEDRGSP
jgi:DNA polymerase III subunit delta